MQISQQFDAEVTPARHFEYVGFWPRVGASLLNALILSPLLIAGIWITGWGIRIRSVWPLIAPSVAIRLLDLFFVVRFGGTLGKLALGMRIVDPNGDYLRPRWALLRDIIAWIGLFTSGLASIHLVNNIPRSYIFGSWIQMFQSFERYGGWWYGFARTLNWLAVPDVLAVPFNQRKRAIHDFIAGSFVITKRSHDATHASLIGQSSERSDALNYQVDKRKEML